MTKEGIQSAIANRLLPNIDSQYGTVKIKPYDWDAIAAMIAMAETNLTNDSIYIEQMDLIYFPMINRQDKDEEIYFTPIWRFMIRSADGMKNIYLDPETYKEIL